MTAGRFGWVVTATSETSRYVRTAFGHDGVTLYERRNGTDCYRFHQRGIDPEGRARGLAAVFGQHATVSQWPDGGWRVEVPA